MEQTGSPTNNAQGSLLANSFDDAYNPNLVFTNTGILALAKADNVAGRGNDDNGSQFFITNQLHAAVGLPIFDFRHPYCGPDNIRQDIAWLYTDGQTTANTTGDFNQPKQPGDHHVGQFL